MVELLISIMIWIALIAKFKIFVKCNKYKGSCGKRNCRLKYYCEKYDNNREIADCRKEHLEKMIRKQTIQVSQIDAN